MLVEKPEEKIPLERYGHRWESNVQVYFTEIGLEAVDWCALAQDREVWRGVVSTVMNLQLS
jgi:hypothetical protein